MIHLKNIPVLLPKGSNYDTIVKVLKNYDIYTHVLKSFFMNKYGMLEKMEKRIKIVLKQAAKRYF